MLWYLIAAIAAYFALVLILGRLTRLNQRKEGLENEELAAECREVLERWRKEDSARRDLDNRELELLL